MKRFNTIFLKLLLTSWVIIILSFVLSGLISTMQFRSSLRHNIGSGMSFMQDRIVRFIETAHRDGWNRQEMIDALQLSIPNQDQVYQFYDDKGHLLYTVGTLPRSIQVDGAFVGKAIAGRPQRIEEDRAGRKLFISALPIHAAQPMDEKVLVIMSLGFERDFHRFMGPFQLGILVSCPIAVIAFLFISRRITKPLKEMSRTALQFAKGRFDKRIEVRSRDEIGQLGDALNHMADGLASLEDMRREFLANVSHDLRSPITSINGFLTALLDGTIPPEKERHYLQMIKDSADRMMKLVADLLDVARIESGQFEIRPEPFNLNEQIRKTIAAMEPQFVQHRMEVELTGGSRDVWVLADPDRIDQVMGNLLQNALHYSPPGGRIDVIVRNHEGDAEVCVRDYGNGMKEEEKAHIWDRFYKGDKARSRKVGMGIGLSIVKHILDRHHSDILVESEVGKGTAFIFALPRYYGSAADFPEE